MDIQQILKLNSDFYESHAQEFSKTRQSGWRGWSKVLEIIKTNKPKNILDVGCGNGRFYKFLKENVEYDFNYKGVDLSENLIEQAKKDFPRVDFEVGNFLDNNFTNSTFDLIVGFGIMHHIPSFDLRVKFINSLGEKLNKNGFLILTFWQDEPKTNKIFTDNSIALEKDGYLVKWGADEKKIRYVHVFKQDEISKIVEAVKPLLGRPVQTYFEDGATQHSNLYLIWQK